MPEFRELAGVDGRITPISEARLPLPDDGLYRGDGVFEVVRLYGGRPFALADHLDRMGRSADSIELDFDRPALESEIGDLLDRLGEADGLLRLIVTRGGRRIAATEPLPVHPPTITLAPVTYTPTVILNGVKAISYAANMEATRIARREGAGEALLVRPDGTVLEPPTSTLFWVSAGRLRTTAVEAGVLASITRGKLIERMEVETGAFGLDEVTGSDEAFLASTTREVQPVERIAGTGLAAAPGPVTLEAAKVFRSIVESETGAF